MLYGQVTCLRPITRRDVLILSDLERSEGSKLSGLSDVLGSNWLVEDKSYRRLLAIEVNGELVGAIALEQITWVGGRAELRIYIGPEGCRGCGIGSDAITTLVDYVFSHTSLNEIYLRVSRDNVRAIACYEKCGFKKTAQLKAGRYQDQGVRDLFLMTLKQSKTATATGQAL